MPTLHGRITDAANGELSEAKVSVVDCEGGVKTPDGAVLKVGNGLVSFYCNGEFSVPVRVAHVALLWNAVLSTSR